MANNNTGWGGAFLQHRVLFYINGLGKTYLYGMKYYTKNEILVIFTKHYSIVLHAGDSPDSANKIP